MTEVTRSSSAMVREPTAIHSAADECSSMHTTTKSEHEKMPDLSETKLRKSRAANNRSPTISATGDLHKNNNSSEDEESSHEEESASEVSKF